MTVVPAKTILNAPTAYDAGAAMLQDFDLTALLKTQLFHSLDLFRLTVDRIDRSFATGAEQV